MGYKTFTTNSTMEFIFTGGLNMFEQWLYQQIIVCEEDNQIYFNKTTEIFVDYYVNLWTEKENKRINELLSYWTMEKT